MIHIRGMLPFWGRRVGLNPLYILIAAYVLFIGCLVGTIIYKNEGHFTYINDDPYIHIRLAEMIHHGHYGINPNEFSAPSSSILWPLLLAPVATVPGREYVPLLLNVCCGIVMIGLFYRFAMSLFLQIYGRHAPVYAAAMVVLLLLAFNVVGQAFVGMEHCLHVLVTALLMLGLFRIHEGEQPPWWFFVALILGPLVRYESLALSGMAILYLIWRGYWRVAIGVSLPLIVLVGGFSLFLIRHGLPPLPSSVVAKSITRTGEPLLSLMWRHFADLYRYVAGWILIGGIALLIPKLWSRSHLLLAVVAIGDAVAHALLARVDGGYPRYTSYVYVVLLLTSIYTYRSQLQWLLSHTQRYAHVVALLVLPWLLAFPELQMLSHISTASNNIYSQQVQMARFVSDFYRAPVAVNDLGLVALYGDQYTLDVWGLGSQEALDFRKSDMPDSEWLDILVKRHDVHMVMIYSPWFNSLPSEWHLLGSLSFDGDKVTAAYNFVNFYATDEATAQRVQPILRPFGDSLPPGAHFVPTQP